MTLSQKAMRKVISGVGWSNPLTHNVYLDTASYLKVYSDDIELVLGDDYTVDELQNEAGYEVTIASFAPGMEPAWYFPDVWVLSVEPPIDQAQDVSLGGSFGARYEVALDALARRLQRVYDMALRAIKSPRTTDPGALDQDDLEIDPDDLLSLPANAAAAAASAAAAAASAAAALVSETAADADADQTALDRIAVAADKATVAADKATVAADKATVAADKATVAADKTTVSGYRDDVEADRVEVATNTSTTTTAKDAAIAAQAAAEAALASTLSAFDSFDDRYLGAKAVAPTLDNDGNALVAGALYYDTVLTAMYVYTGSAWAAAYVDGATVLLKAQNLNDLLDKPTARTNLSVYSIAAIDAYAANAASKTTPVDADSVAIVDSVASNVQKRVTFANLWVWITAKFNGTAKSTPVAADRVYIGDSAASNVPKYSTFTQIMTLFGALIAGSTAKTTPVAADSIVIADSAASNATKRVTFTELATLFGLLINGSTAKTTPVDADLLVIADSAASNATKKVTWANLKATINAGGATQGTLNTTTGGTSIDFTGIPAGVKWIDIEVRGLSSTGADGYMVQIGDSGGIETTGYLGAYGNTGNQANLTTGFGFANSGGGAADVYHGTIRLTRQDAATFAWTAASLVSRSNSGFVYWGAGGKALSAELDRIRITTTGGTQTFDANVGINITYGS